MPLSIDPGLASAVAAMAAAPKSAVHDIEARRAGFGVVMEAWAAAMPEYPDVETTIYQVGTHDGTEVPVYGFVKKGTTELSPGPAILHCHGGGMILGSVASLQKGLAHEVHQTGVPVFSVEYRVAPEARDTSLVADCYAALVWLHENAKQFNIDPARIAVMGESAGGGIAAGVALMARDKNLQPPLAKQILTYPMLDDRNLTPNPAIAAFAVWTYEDNITGWTALLGDKAGKPDADVSYYAAPARAPSLAGLPPAYICLGELDIFRDEDIRYAQRLAAENISTELHLFPGVPHAFELLAPNIFASQTAIALKQRAMQSF